MWDAVEAWRCVCGREGRGEEAVKSVFITKSLVIERCCSLSVCLRRDRLRGDASLETEAPQTHTGATTDRERRDKGRKGQTDRPTATETETMKETETERDGEEQIQGLTDRDRGELITENQADAGGPQPLVRRQRQRGRRQ